MQIAVDAPSTSSAIRCGSSHVHVLTVDARRRGTRRRRSRRRADPGVERRVPGHGGAGDRPSASPSSTSQAVRDLGQPCRRHASIVSRRNDEISHRSALVDAASSSSAIVRSAIGHRSGRSPPRRRSFLISTLTHMPVPHASRIVGESRRLAGGERRRLEIARPSAARRRGDDRDAVGGAAHVELDAVGAEAAARRKAATVFSGASAGTRPGGRVPQPLTSVIVSRASRRSSRDHALVNAAGFVS